MRKSKSSLIPIRGSVEDWGPGKHQRNLERKEAYARRMREQAARGQPDFEKLLAGGVVPAEKRGPAERKKAAKTTARAKKSAKKPAKKKKGRR